MYDINVNVKLKVHFFKIQMFYMYIKRIKSKLYINWHIVVKTVKSLRFYGILLKYLSS